MYLIYLIKLSINFSSERRLSLLPLASMFQTVSDGQLYLLLLRQS